MKFHDGWSRKVERSRSSRSPNEIDRAIGRGSWVARAQFIDAQCGRGAGGGGAECGRCEQWPRQGRFLYEKHGRRTTANIPSPRSTLLHGQHALSSWARFSTRSPLRKWSAPHSATDSLPHSLLGGFLSAPLAPVSVTQWRVLMSLRMQAQNMCLRCAWATVFCVVCCGRRQRLACSLLSICEPQFLQLHFYSLIVNYQAKAEKL